MSAHCHIIVCSQDKLLRSPAPVLHITSHDKQLSVLLQPAPHPSFFSSPSQIKVDIYHGSQTGTAENYAKQLITQGKKQGFKARLVDLANYKKEDLTTGGLAVFIVATYGEGDPTDNAIEFSKWIKDESLDATLLKAMKYTVFGLGNRQYEQYNKMGKVCVRLLILNELCNPNDAVDPNSSAISLPSTSVRVCVCV